MPGNSDRKGAIRTRRGGNPVAGSGGRRKKGLEGRGPTPKAEDRPNHKAFRRAQHAKSAAPGERRTPSRRRDETGPDVVAGRNSVLEALRAGVPVSTLFVAERIDRDDRVREVLTLAAEANIPMLEGPRSELDRLAHGASHQGLLIQVPPYDYADPNDLLDVAAKAGVPPLLVALDGVTDPRNLGAIVRSAGAFGAHGVVIPQRRAAQMSASAQKAAAGAAARLPVARAVNLARQLGEYAEAGLQIVGLDGAGKESVDEVAADLADGIGVVIVVGSEGQGLSRLVQRTCDRVARIDIARSVESLNASVAASLAVYEFRKARG